MTGAGRVSGAGEWHTAMAVPPVLQPLRRRADFVRLRQGRRRNRTAFQLQSAPNTFDVIRVGITVTRQVGNAVIRNRIRRRLREAALMVLPTLGIPGTDYVMVARLAALDRPWPALLDDLRGALVERPVPAPDPKL